jgi:photosystem II stability/assembly factor-like uncharacterized protein
MKSERALIATRKGLFSAVRGAAGWAIEAVAFPGDNVPMVLADRRDGAVYAVLGHGHFGTKLHRSIDGGASWNEIAVPAYPPKPEGFEDLNPVQQKPIDWSLELIWALESGGADEPGRLWAGTVPGGLFRSDDGGGSWSLVRSLWDLPDRRRWSGGGLGNPGIHSICVDPRDSKHITIAVSTGGVWQTRDGGATWAVGGPGMRAEYMPPELQHDPVPQDVHHLVACPARPDVLWAQHHNGIFRSTDGAASWTELRAQPSSFGFAAAVHPTDADTAWFVPAIKDEKRIPVEGRLVVTRTRDGGRTFQTLTRGLPQAWAYDLVYRHGLDIDPSGDRLVFGSTTGNLWVSEDQGDSWQTLAHHLPPIYCVRFA